MNTNKEKLLIQLKLQRISKMIEKLEEEREQLFFQLDEYEENYQYDMVN